MKDVFAKACSNGSSGNGGEQRGGSAASASSPPSSIAKAYAFVEDRLRAVRQDLTVQGLVLAASAGAAEVLKTAATFYIVAGYLMSDEVKSKDKCWRVRLIAVVFLVLVWRAPWFWNRTWFRAGPINPCAIEHVFVGLGILYGGVSLLSGLPPALVKVEPRSGPASYRFILTTLALALALALSLQQLPPAPRISARLWCGAVDMVGGVRVRVGNRPRVYLPRGTSIIDWTQRNICAVLCCA